MVNKSDVPYSCGVAMPDGRLSPTRCSAGSSRNQINITLIFPDRDVPAWNNEVVDAP